MKRFTLKHIKSKIVFFLVPIALIMIIVFGAVMLHIGRSALENETTQKMEQTLLGIKYRFDSNLFEAKKVVRVLENELTQVVDFDAIADDTYLEETALALVPVVKREAQNHYQSMTAYIFFNHALTGSPHDVFFADETGDGIVKRQTPLPADYFTRGPTTLDDKSWWFGAIESRQLYWTRPYDWTMDNGKTIRFVSITKALYYKDELIAVVGTDISYDMLKKTIDSYQIGNNGFAYLRDATGEILYTPEVFSDAPDDVYTLEAPLDNGWSIGIQVDRDEIFKPLQNYFFLVIIMLIVTFSLIVLVALKLSDTISTPLTQITGIINLNSNYLSPMTLPESLATRADEIGVLAQALVNMNQNLIASHERALAERHLRKDTETQLELLTKTLERSDSGFFITDMNFQLIYVNKTYVEITGFDVTLNQDILDDSGVYLTKTQKERLEASKMIQGESEQLRADGTPYPLQFYITKLLEPNVYYLGIVKDLTQVKLKEKKLNYIKYYDIMTQLPNRELFYDSAEKLLETVQETQYVCALLNLDNFRVLNSVLGTEACNRIIMQVATRFKSFAKTRGVIGRIEGDEFALFCHIDSPKDAELYLKQLKHVLSEPYTIDGESIYVTFSVGYALYPESGNTFAQLIKNANTALIQIKSAGKNQIQKFIQAHNTLHENEYVLLKNIRFALERDELSLVYQPQVDVVTGKVTGVEALLRWSLEGRAVNPSTFIPIAEQSRWIVPIGAFVLEEAFKTAYELSQIDASIDVSINLSVEQLKFNLLVKTLGQLLEKYPVSPDCITFEVTESLLVTAVPEAVEVIHYLKEKGFRIALDDFGMGYSSLSYLKRIPFDVIKLDRTFIKDYPEKDTGSIASLIIHLAAELKVDLIAEGVESEAQKAFLLDNGCQTIQGYLYAKPLEKDAVIQYIQKHNILN